MKIFYFGHDKSAQLVVSPFWLSGLLHRFCENRTKICHCSVRNKVSQVYVASWSVFVTITDFVTSPYVTVIITKA